MPDDIEAYENKISVLEQQIEDLEIELTEVEGDLEAAKEEVNKYSSLLDSIESTMQDYR